MLTGSALTLLAALVAFVGLRRLAPTLSVEPTAEADDGRQPRGAEELEAPRSSRRPPAEVRGLKDGENHESPRHGRLESRHRLAGIRSLALTMKTSDALPPKLEGVRRQTPERKGDNVMSDLRSALSSDDRDYPPGPIASVKQGATSDPGYPQPQDAEVESARLLANDARQTLRSADFSDGDIDRLADDFIAEDRGEETGAFIDWAHRVRRAVYTPPLPQGR
jgi:hypothetical protein